MLAQRTVSEKHLLVLVHDQREGEKGERTDEICLDLSLLDLMGFREGLLGSPGAKGSTRAITRDPSWAVSRRKGIKAKQMVGLTLFSSAFVCWTLG